MEEQLSALLRLKVPSTFINSDLDRDEEQLRYRLLSNKCIKLLYPAPERILCLASKYAVACLVRLVRDRTACKRQIQQSLTFSATMALR